MSNKEVTAQLRNIEALVKIGRFVDAEKRLRQLETSANLVLFSLSPWEKRIAKVEVAIIKNANNNSD